MKNTAASDAADQHVAGEFVDFDGERYYAIRNVDRMPPFFISLISDDDHWLFVSSTGGLTCGRRAPENALFPYCTDDKIHDACETTGPKTLLLVSGSDRTLLWQPFDTGPLVYSLERNLFKNVPGKLRYEVVEQFVKVYAGVESQAEKSSSDPKDQAKKRFWDDVKIGVIAVVQYYSKDHEGNPAMNDENQALAKMSEFQQWMRDHKSIRKAPWVDPKPIKNK